MSRCSLAWHRGTLTQHIHLPSRLYAPPVLETLLGACDNPKETVDVRGGTSTLYKAVAMAAHGVRDSGNGSSIRIAHGRQHRIGKQKRTRVRKRKRTLQAEVATVRLWHTSTRKWVSNQNFF